MLWPQPTRHIANLYFRTHNPTSLPQPHPCNGEMAAGNETHPVVSARPTLSCGGSAITWLSWGVIPGTGIGTRDVEPVRTSDPTTGYERKVLD